MQRRSGFTLLEMMVVLLIFGIVAAIAGSFLAGSFEIISASETRAKLNNNARAALGQITESIKTASSIPRSIDRNRNGLTDDDYRDFGSNASWVIGFEGDDGPTVPLSFDQTEAYSDRLMLEHRSGFKTAGLIGTFVRDVYSGSDFKLKLSGSNRQRVASRRVQFRLAIPADFDPANQEGTPYYMAPKNAGRLANQNIPDFPSVVSFGGTSQTAVLTEDLYYQVQTYDTTSQASVTTGGGNPGIPNTGTTETPSGGTPDLASSVETISVKQQPVAGNITRMHFEYLHEVPVYMADPDNNCDPVLVDSDGDGTEEKPVRVGRRLVPIDVAVNGVQNGQPWTNTDLADVYDQSLSASDRIDGFEAWNMDNYYTEDFEDRAPQDHNAYLKCGNEVQFSELEYDIEELVGEVPPDLADDNSDNGHADGIPDGDGIPDDPVPCWWLPYMEAIRVTLVATPTGIIEQRRNRSGRSLDVDKDGTQETVYYKLDSPYPHLYRPGDGPATQDPFQAVKNDPETFIGEGKDVVVTKTVRTENMPSLTPVTDPLDQRLQQVPIRRADFNLTQGEVSCLQDFGESQLRANSSDLLRRLAQRLEVDILELFQ